MKATPNTQRITRIVTLLADEKTVLALAGAVWVASRLVRNGSKREADQLVVSAIVAGAFPHLIKAIVARRRPDRSVTEPRNGIGKSGSAWNSFPSGHAVHLGAIARPLASLAPPHLRPFVWPAVVSLAATRIVILAHYMTDVLAGMAIGTAVESAVRHLVRRRE